MWGKARFMALKIENSPFKRVWGAFGKGWPGAGFVGFFVFFFFFDFFHAESFKIRMQSLHTI